MVRVEAFPEMHTPVGWREQVRQLHEQQWPSPPADVTGDNGGSHDPELRPWSMLLIDDDTVLCTLDVLFKEIEHAGYELAAAGLSAVVTHPAHRRKGYGRTLVTRAREALPGLGVDLGLFTCDRELGAFYDQCGWHQLPGTVLVGGTPDEPFPSDQPGFDKITLGAFFTPAAIHARESLIGARIMLYPGAIDKLW